MTMIERAQPCIPPDAVERQQLFDAVATQPAAALLYLLASREPETVHSPAAWTLGNDLRRLSDVPGRSPAYIYNNTGIRRQMLNLSNSGFFRATGTGEYCVDNSYADYKLLVVTRALAIQDEIPSPPSPQELLGWKTTFIPSEPGTASLNVALYQTMLADPHHSTTRNVGRHDYTGTSLDPFSRLRIVGSLKQLGKLGIVHDAGPEHDPGRVVIDPLLIGCITRLVTAVNAIETDATVPDHLQAAQQYASDMLEDRAALRRLLTKNMHIPTWRQHRALIDQTS